MVIRLRHQPLLPTEGTQPKFTSSFSEYNPDLRSISHIYLLMPLVSSPLQEAESLETQPHTHMFSLRELLNFWRSWSQMIITIMVRKKTGPEGVEILACGCLLPIHCFQSLQHWVHQVNSAPHALLSQVGLVLLPTNMVPEPKHIIHFRFPQNTINMWQYSNHQESVWMIWNTINSSSPQF